ncbi:MAG TPA: hypothetical protein VK037_06565 [Pseudogracilibacillus sp.]|nr:hypothetical protein [Pseudogracilibacillus sp.]
MEQIKLKYLLENLIKEIENNDYVTIDGIVNKLSLEIKTNILYKDLKES